MSRRERPPDGPGSNGLRGGKNSYSLKTAHGNWIEDYGGSSMYKRGFTTDNYETECQHQQTGRSMCKDPEFGANLPRRYIDPRTTTDVFNPPAGPQSDTWETNTQAMLKSTGATKMLQSTNRLPTGNVNAEELDKYRKTWTNDTVESRTMRFETESRRAGNGGAPSKFKVHSVRFLPGTPIAFERFRERLIERYGILGFSSLRHSMGGRREITSSELQKIINGLGVAMSKIEVGQMLAYLTTGDVFAADRLIKIIQGGMDASQSIEIAQKAFDTLLYNLGDPAAQESGVLTLDQCKLLLNGKKFPDIADGVLQFLSAYCSSNEELSVEGFILLNADMHNSACADYPAVVKDLWGDAM